MGAPVDIRTPKNNLLGLAFAAATAGSASAQEFSPEPWEFDIAVYLWGASIGGETTSGETVDIGFDDLIENLQFGGMAFLSAQRGNWGAFADLIYLDVQSNQNLLVPNSAGGLTGLSTGIGLNGFISTFGGSYQFLEANSTTLTATAGARYLWLNADLNLSRGFGFGGIDVTGSGANWDAVLGLRGRTEINDRWYLTYYGDVGAGDSKFTGQALLSANYRFERFDVAFGYRYLYWNFDDYLAFDTLNLSGPFAGLRFTF